VAVQSMDVNKNSSGDEIANVNFLLAIARQVLRTYFKIPKKKTYFV